MKILLILFRSDGTIAEVHEAHSFQQAEAKGNELFYCYPRWVVVRVPYWVMPEEKCPTTPT